MMHPFARCIVLMAGVIAGALGLAENAQAAYQPGAVVTPQPVANMATLIDPTKDFSNTPSVNLCGYSSCGDGGDGIYNLQTCTPDAYNGACASDGHGHTWKRQNLNGSIAQFGVTLGSAYDWNVHGASATDASPVIEAAQTAGLASGIATTHCNGMQLYLATDLVLAGHSSFTCDVSPGITTDSVGYLNLPGTLRLAHGVTIRRASDASSFYGAYVLPSWYTSAPSNAQEGFALIQNMVSNGDTGVMCDQKGCIDHDLTLLGFDTGYEAFESANSIWDNINVDANVGFWIQKVGGNTNNQNFNSSPNLTRSIPSELRNQLFTVTKIENDGGVCKATGTPQGSALLTDIQYANYVYIARLTDTSASCNGQWKISNLNTGAGTFDLIGSAALGPSSYSHWAAGSRVIYTSNNVNIAPGNVITGFSANGIPNGTTVSYVWNLPVHPSGYTTTTGSANAYVANEGSLAPCTLADSLNEYLAPNFTNTGAATLNIALNASCGGGMSGAIPIQRSDGTTLQANDIISGSKLLFILNSGATAWLLQQPKVILSVPTTLAQTVPVNVGYTNAVCSSCGSSARAEISAAARVDAGGSDGGVAAGGLGYATGVLVGGPAAKGFDDTDKVAGFTCTDCTVFDHSIFGHVQNSNNTKFQDWRTDSEGSTDNPNQVLMLVDGQSNSMQLNGVKSAKGGIGLLANIAYPNNPDKACVTWTGASIASSTGTFPVFDAEQGCLLVTAGQSSGNGVNFIAKAVSKAGFMNVYMPGTTNFYEGTSARASTSTWGSAFAGGDNNFNLVTSTVPAVTVAGPTTVTPTFVFWPCDATSNDVTFTLPDATLSQNYNFQFTKIDSSSHSCIISAAGGQTITGMSSWYLSSQNQRLAVTSDGSSIWRTQ